MAYDHSSLADDWGDLGSLHGDPTSYSLRRGYRGGIPTEAQQVLEDAFVFVANPTPSPAHIDVIAHRTNLNTEIVRTWFHRLSEHSDPANAIAPLHPPGPVSVQSDIQFNSSWVDTKAESVADSGFFSNQPIKSGAPQHLDSSNYSASLFPYRFETEPSLAFSEQIQPSPLLDASSQANPWFPGSRLDQPGYFFDYTCNLAANSQPSHNEFDVLEYDQPSSNVGPRSKPASLCESLRPCTESSEAIGSGRSRSKHTGVKSEGDITVCDLCGAQFTGRYRRGNCSRHIRQQHSGNVAHLNSDCVCRVCKKGFNRQDARRKHEWKKHQLQDTKPYPRRQAASLECDSSHVGTYDLGSDQGTFTCTSTILEEPSVNIHYKIPAQPRRAHNFFAAVKAELDDGLYDVYCERFLARCTRIVEELRNKQSDLQDVFTRGLHDISMQLLPEQYRSSHLSHAHGSMNDAQNTAESEDDKGSDSCQYRKAASRRTSRPSSRFDPYAGRLSKNSDADPITAISKRFEDPKYQEHDCPIHKWHLMHSRVSPCNGCGKRYMNGVRQHLLPSYSQQHQGKITFIQRCKTCAEDFIDKNLWDLGRHGTGTCRGRSQPQGHSLICWARLYLKIYPEEHSVPSPYRNDPRLLPDNLVVLLREDLHLPRTVPYNNLQAPLTSPTALNNPALRQNEPVNRDVVDPERIATLDTLLSQAEILYTRFLAQEYAETVHEPINVQAVEAHFRQRLYEFRQNLFVQPNQTHPHDLLNATNQALQPPPVLHRPQAPIIGGAADFPAPAYQLNPFIGVVQVSDSDMGTLPSSQEYHQGDVSFGFPSSSHTDYDFNSSTYVDQSQPPRPQFYTPAEPSDCAPSPHTPGLWLSPYEVASSSRTFAPHSSPYEEALLDMPGSSRMPQLLVDQHANAQMMLDIERMMESSPEESRYALSSYDENGLSEID